MTKITKSESYKRLMALDRVAGPDDPIYQGGLVMTDIRKPRHEHPTRIDHEGVKTTMTQRDHPVILESLPDGKDSKFAQGFKGQIAAANLQQTSSQPYPMAPAAYKKET